MTNNKRIVLASRPKGLINKDNFTIDTKSIPKAQDGQIVVKTLYISVDPYMRGRMNASLTSYVQPFEVNEPISGFLTAEVTESKSDKYQVGDLITGVFPFEEYILLDTEKDTIFKIHEAFKSGKIPLSYSLSALGMPGMTSYIGLLKIGDLKSGDNVLVSAAAGAVGSMVGQIAKIKGCRVVGIAGSDEKVKTVKEKFGFDDCFNYKTTKYLDGIKKTCPNGVDVYFDNVGGDSLDAAIMNLNKFGRIVLCGAISQYNDEQQSQGPRLTPLLIGKEGRLQGFIVGNHRDMYPQATKDMAQWVMDGKLKVEETVHEGFENVVPAFIGLFTGENTGKMVIKVADPSSTQ